MSETIRDFAAGALRLSLEDRSLGGDGGPAIRVYGSTAAGQQDRQLLRFDCFRTDAHYHYDPDGRDEVIHLKGPDAENSVAWSLTQLREKLPEMVKHAGGSEAAVTASGSSEARNAVAQVAAALGQS